MASQLLSVYLNDHLAGSQMGLELLDSLRKLDGSADWATLEREVDEDRAALEQLMKSVGASRSLVRRATAWVAEKMTEFKTSIDDSSRSGALQRLELIEALAIGIDGKKALWTALQIAAERTPALDGVDYPRLIARAETQRQFVEAHRLRAASEALH